MLTRVRRRLVTVALCAAAGLSACGSAGPDASPGPAASQPPLTAGTPDESEVPPGCDASPDGPPPVADADLDDAALTRLLRTRSSASTKDGACTPADVSARFSGLDVAMGHRYSSLVVTNDSDQPCRVDGVPGLGARGAWGHRFTLVVERETTAPGPAGPVLLAPGAEASATVEWTGELAGADSEPVSLVVVQLAPGQVPLPLEAQLTDVPPDQERMDIGISTTVRLGAFALRPEQGLDDSPA